MSDNAWADIQYVEEVATAFGSLLARAAIDMGAPIFAFDMAKRGANPDELDLMAEVWTRFGFEFPEFADELREFADRLRKVER